MLTTEAADLAGRTCKVGEELTHGSYMVWTTGADLV